MYTDALAPNTWASQAPTGATALIRRPASRNSDLACAVSFARNSMTTPHNAHTEQPGLKGKRALVTGGTTGIGRAIAVLLASYGVKTFICGRSAEHLNHA